MYYIVFLIIILAVSLLFKYVDKKTDFKTNKKYLLVAFVLFTLFLGLRGADVGLDMGNYKNFFVIANNGSFKYLINNVNFEIGFKMYTKIITLLTDNYQVYIFITSVISLIGVYSFIKDNSKNYYASILLFLTFDYYIYFFCTLRQVLALSILLIAYKCLKQQKSIAFLGLVLLATTFHKTAIVFLVLYLSKFIVLKRKYIIYYLLFCLILFVLRVPLINFFTELLYNQYVDYKDMSGSGYTMLVFFMAAVVGICYFFKKFDLMAKDNKMPFIMLLITIPFQILSTTQGLLARIVLYFSISLVILIPNAMETLEAKKKTPLLALYTVLLIAFFCLEVFRNSMYVPYKLLTGGTSYENYVLNR